MCHACDRHGPRSRRHQGARTGCLGEDRLYEYVLAKGELPTAEKAFRSKAHGKQPLTADQREELQARLKKTTFPIPASYWDGKTDKQLLQEALEEKYARADRHECSH